MANGSAVGHIPAGVKRFVEVLGRLDRGDLASLRRSAGRAIGDAHDAMGLFYRILPSEVAGGRDEEIYFLVSALFGLNDKHHTGDFGTTLLAVRTPANSKGVDRRMAVLLDSEFGNLDGRLGGGEMAYRLRQCVRLAAGRDVGVDWPRLLADLLWWSHPDKRVRKQWARSYYTATGGSASPGLDSGKEE